MQGCIDVCVGQYYIGYIVDGEQEDEVDGIEYWGFEGY